MLHTAPLNRSTSSRVTLRLTFSSGLRGFCAGEGVDIVYINISVGMCVFWDHVVYTAGNGDPMHGVCIQRRIPRAWEQQEVEVDTRIIEGK